MLVLLLGAAAPSPEADYAERAAKLEGEKDAKAWLKLADFAEEHLPWEAREEALRKALAQDPEDAEAHARLDEVKVGQAWLPAGEAEAREAEEKQAKGLVFYGKGWIPAAEADKLREADRKEAGWDVAFRLDTAHLRVYSGRPLAFTRRLAALLEDEVGVYRKLYGGTLALDPEPPTVRVYVFADRDGFARVVAQVVGRDPPGKSPGMYSPETGVLYVGDSAKGGSEGAVLQTAAHEMTHALDHRWARVPEWPNWLVEGRAHHLGFAIRGRRILPGTVAVPPGARILKTLGEAIDGADLREFLALTPEGFVGEGIGSHYALSWALVHFLFHGEGGKYAPGFRAFLQGLPGKGSVADFEKAVGPLSGLEPAFKRYVKETLIPGAKPSR